MSQYAIGIDTGGTFTDGVIYELDRREIVVKTKVITTRNDLTRSVEQCLDNLLHGFSGRDPESEMLNQVRMVSLSTTLATNATVEGQGAEVGLIVIGHQLKDPLPTTHLASLSGGCDIRGNIREELDPEKARRAIGDMLDHVESFAVSGYMSIRNPVQELEVKRLVTELTGYPVVCAHELSGDLGIYERTVTAVLNARLIPLITHLIDAVKQALQNRGIHAPVMVVKGDGSLMFESAAREKPVETILSGPAASLIGAAALSGITDGVVVDMGGTTTDIAVLNGGRPAVRDEGARVGGWLTRVKAADITTIGLGGDSIIRVSKDGVLTIGPQKVFPLSWIVSQHPFLLEELHTVERSAFSPLDAQPTSVLVLIREPAGMLLTDTERGILEQIREGPHTLCHVSDKLGVNVNLMGWERLVQIGAVHRAGCTPTDILHVTGRFTEWDQSAAAIGVRVMADRYGTTVDDFIGEVLRMISYRLFTLIVEELVLNSMERGRGKMVLQESEESSFFLQRMFEAHESKEGNIRFSAQASLPVIGVGAPARAYFPDVLKRMQGRLVVPGDADVANAVGTVNGRVIERVRLLIKPGHSGGFFVFTPEGRKIFTVFDESAEYCERYGREYVRNRARKAGASNIAVSLQRRDRYGSLSGSSGKKDDEARVFIESEIQCEAEGVPW